LNEHASPSKAESGPRRHAERESGMASIGIMLAGVFVAVLGASGWWTLDTYRASVSQSQQQQAEAIGGVLARLLEEPMRDGDWTAVRRHVMETAHLHGYEECSIVLADGQVIADADPARLTRDPIPLKWPAAASPMPVENGSQDAIRFSIPLAVEFRGQATLTIASTIKYPPLAHEQARTGVALIAIGGLAGLLLTYRTLKRHVAPSTAIRHSLRNYLAGQRDTSALTIHSSMGIDAIAWNQLLQDVDRLRQRQVLARAADRVSERTVVEGEGNLCDALWLGVLVIDEAMRIRYANGAAGTLMQSSAKALLGQEPPGPMSSRVRREMIQKVLSGEIRHRLTTTIEPENGTSPEGMATGSPSSVLRMTVLPIQREHSRVAIVVLEDITQQSIADEARTGFVAHAAHELRSPLTTIRLYQELLVDRGDSDPATRAKCINMIGQESRRLERMVNDMLSLSQMQAGRLEIVPDDVRFDALLAELREDCEPQAQARRQTLTFNLPPKLPVLKGDRDKLMLVLHNLVANAIKYTPSGGGVTVSACESSEDGRNWLIVDVTDTGIGIRPDECERIFERFYRAKDSRVSKITGTGLGLALAREVARFHGGEVTVKSQLDHGSTFTIRLPLVSTQLQAPVARAA
jgi:signal transduction histidine kinase